MSSRNNSPVLIELGTTRAIIHILPSSMFGQYVRTVTKHKLTDYEFVPRARRYVPTRKFLSYDEKAGKLYVPINAAPLIISELEAGGIPLNVIDENIISPRKIDLKMLWTHRDYQEEMVDYLSVPDEPRRGLALQAGKGKTHCAISALCNLGHAGLIIVSRLQHQWLKAIREQTDIGDDVCLIQGSKSLFDLMESERKPKVIIGSLETIRSYCTSDVYDGVPPYEKFISYFGIGTKIMDEVHLNFHADTLIDLKSNIKNNIYLTATFAASGSHAKKIFKLIYPPKMRFGEDLYDHYVDTYSYLFVGEVDERKCVRVRGYNHAKYEEELLKKPMKLNNFFKHVLSPIIYAHYINKKNPGEKMLMYFIRINMVHAVVEFLKEELKQYDLKISEYIGGSDKELLETQDILVSTPKSTGVGTDIKNLRTVINTVSCKAETVVEQAKGRLRKLPNNVVPEYIEIADFNLKPCQRHWQERKPLLEQNSRNYFQFKLH